MNEILEFIKLLSESEYDRMAEMTEREHKIASNFCYSFTRRAAIPC